MSFPRYPKYKPSGVEWLGEVPEGWVTQRLKHSSRIPIRNGLGESAESDDPTQPRYVRITDIKSPRELHESTFKSLPKETAELARFHVGDILFACVGATFGKSYLHSVDAGPMCFAGYLARYSPKPSVDSRFISYWTESRTFWDQLQANVIQSTIQNFSAAKYRELVLVVPAAAEQTAIAEFLDRETAKIDGLVAEQRRLMELLKEKRQAVISHAVTKGLNPHASMKPSGIEWLGDVPAGWKVAPLKYIAEIQPGYAFSSDDFVDEGIPVLRIGDISTDGGIDFSNARYLPAHRQTDHSDVVVICGDIVMAMTGATIGKAGRYSSDQPALLNQRVCIFRPVEPNSQEYLWQVLGARFYTEHIALTAFGGAQPNISDKQLLQCIVPLPPASDQIAIAEFLEAELAKFDTLTAEAQRAIDLLQERRTALISNAVTGQIDVREVFR